MVYLFFISFSKGFAFDKHKNHSPFSKMMSDDIPYYLTDVKECLLSREVNITDIESISACKQGMANLEELLKKALVSGDQGEWQEECKD